MFAEPVTDDIAPGYSALIKHPMDLKAMAGKLVSHAYSSVEEFKNDFVLMCKNAMTYNAPDTVYYTLASNVMVEGLKLISKVRRSLSLSLSLSLYTLVSRPSIAQLVEWWTIVASTMYVCTCMYMYMYVHVHCMCSVLLCMYD